jgi:hypothetical protein
VRKKQKRKKMRELAGDTREMERQCVGLLRFERAVEKRKKDNAETQRALRNRRKKRRKKPENTTTSRDDKSKAETQVLHPPRES